MQRCGDADVAAEIQRRWPDVASIAAVRDGVLTAHIMPERREANGIQAQLGISQMEYHVICPALLSLTSARGDLDMGGPPYFLILRGHYRAMVLYALANGHMTLSLRAQDGPAALANDVLAYLRGAGLVKAGQTGPLSGPISDQLVASRPDKETRWYDWYRGGAPASHDVDIVHACRSIDPSVRYAALVDRGALVAMCSRMGPVSESSDMAASDRIEETMVNPAALALTAGAARLGAWSAPPSLIVRYPGLFAAVIPTPTGHITLSIDRSADPVPVADQAMAWVASVREATPTAVP